MTATDQERKVVRCSGCKLMQFTTESGLCRRCRKPYRKMEQFGAKELKVIAKGIQKNLMASGPTPDLHAAPGSGIAVAVKLIRSVTGMSQSDVAARMGCPRTYVSKVERNCAVPTPESCQRLAAALEVQASFLIQLAQCMEADGGQAA